MVKQPVLGTTPRARMQLKGHKTKYSSHSQEAFKHRTREGGTSARATGTGKSLCASHNLALTRPHPPFRQKCRSSHWNGPRSDEGAISANFSPLIYQSTFFFLTTVTTTTVRSITSRSVSYVCFSSFFSTNFDAPPPNKQNFQIQDISETCTFSCVVSFVILLVF